MGNGIGIFKRNDTLPINLTLTNEPDAAPTFRILDASRTKVYPVGASETMTGGSGTYWWHTGVTVDAAADAGNYTIEFTAVIDGNTLVATKTYDVTLNDFDDIKDAIDTLSGGTGAYNATINVKDDVPAAVPNAKVTIHNAADADSPIIAGGTTDALGEVTLNLEGNLYVRVSKAGFLFTSTAINVTASGTYNVTGTTLTASNPSDPDVCRIRVYPLTLAKADVTGLTIKISTSGSLTIIDDQLISNASGTFTEDATTTPDSYYFDAVQGAEVHIVNEVIGLDHSFTVPAASTAQIKADASGNITLA